MFPDPHPLVGCPPLKDTCTQVVIVYRKIFGIARAICMIFSEGVVAMAFAGDVVLTACMLETVMRAVVTAVATMIVIYAHRPLLHGCLV